MRPRYKQRCVKCRKNMVLITSRWQFPVCYDCQKKELDGEIKNPKMKKMFDIPEEFYKVNPFLRDIKINYLKFEKLSEKQVECFKETVMEMEKAWKAKKNDEKKNKDKEEEK